MDDDVLRDQIAAASAYEQLHVPASFRQWAPLVCDAARIGPGHRVLDVACGTGVLAREATARVGPTGVVAGLDPDPGMLAGAGQLASAIDRRHGLSVLGVTLDETAIARVLSEAEIVLEPYASVDEHVVFDASAHIVTGQAS